MNVDLDLLGKPIIDPFAQPEKPRKVPNLKGLRDMIKKNAQPPQRGSERTLGKNESECSFTLTDDEDRENAETNH